MRNKLWYVMSAGMNFGVGFMGFSYSFLSNSPAPAIGGIVALLVGAMLIAMSTVPSDWRL